MGLSVWLSKLHSEMCIDQDRLQNIIEIENKDSYVNAVRETCLRLIDVRYNNSSLYSDNRPKR